MIPQIDTFTVNKFTKEEMKMVNETNKILDKNINVNATCVRVPSYMGHAESIYIELEKDISFEDLEKALQNAEGIKYSISDYGLQSLLRHGDRNSMHFSVESRVPFLSNEFVDFMLTLPENFLVSDKGQSKYIFKLLLNLILVKIGFRIYSNSSRFGPFINQSPKSLYYFKSGLP